MIINDPFGSVATVDRSKNALKTISEISSTNLELFGRVRTSLSSPQFTYQNEYNKGEAQWVEKITGTATATHNPTNASVDITVNAEGDKVIRQTRQYFRYYSGKTLATLTTFYTGALPAFLAFRNGYFETANGIYLERIHNDFFVCIRKNGVDTKVPRSEWNGDNLTGVGKSTKVFNFDKSVILGINLQWLGVGNVLVGIETTDGEVTPIHTFHNVGVVESTYMRTANLPIRYELEALPGFTGTYTVEQICAAVSTEDGACGEVSEYNHSADTGITNVPVTTRRSVLAIRPKLTFNSLTNRARVTISSTDLRIGTNDCLWELIWNPTYQGTPTWTSADDESTVEYSLDANVITGGVKIGSGFGISGGGQVRQLINRSLTTNYPLGLDVDGVNPSSVALVCTAFTGTSNVGAVFNFKEVY